MFLIHLNVFLYHLLSFLFCLALTNITNCICNIYSFAQYQQFLSKQSCSYIAHYHYPFLMCLARTYYLEFQMLSLYIFLIFFISLFFLHKSCSNNTFCFSVISNQFNSPISCLKINYLNLF